MAVDLNAKTTKTALRTGDAFVVVDKTQSAAADKPDLVDKTAIGRSALLGSRKVTGTSTTLAASDNNSIVGFQNAGLVTATLAKTNPVGWSCMWVQEHATGQVVFEVEAGAPALRHFQGHDASAGQWTAGSLVVIANAGGAAAEYLLTGITAAA